MEGVDMGNRWGVREMGKELQAETEREIEKERGREREVTQGDR